MSHVAVDAYVDDDGYLVSQYGMHRIRYATPYERRASHHLSPDGTIRTKIGNRKASELVKLPGFHFLHVGNPAFEVSRRAKRTKGTRSR
jgi:hypothetical protein